MEKKNINCVHCGDPLTGKQQKYCSDRCRKRVLNKKWKQKHWKVINAKIKTKHIEKKLRRKILIEQEVKKRKEA